MTDGSHRVSDEQVWLSLTSRDSLVRSHSYLLVTQPTHRFHRPHTFLEKSAVARSHFLIVFLIVITNHGCIPTCYPTNTPVPSTFLERSALARSHHHQYYHLTILIIIIIVVIIITILTIIPLPAPTSSNHTGSTGSNTFLERYAAP